MRIGETKAKGTSFAFKARTAALKRVGVVYVKADKSIAFVPLSILASAKQGGGKVLVKLPRGTMLECPAFETLSELIALVSAAGTENSRVSAMLLENRVQPIYEGDFPSKLEPRELKALFTLAEGYGKELVYLKKEKMYVLAEPEVPQIVSKIGLFMLPLGLVVSYSSAEDLLSVLVPARIQPPIIPELWEMARACPLPQSTGNPQGSPGAKSFGVTHIGTGERTSNQDFFIAGENIFVVADGLGGGEKGEKAAAIGARVTYYCLQNGYSLDMAIFLAHREIKAYNRRRCVQAGTTIVAGFIDASGLAHLGQVGDSRIYLLNQSGGLYLLTRDQTYGAHLVDRDFPGQFQFLTLGVNLEEWDERLDKTRRGHVLIQALGKEIVPFITRHPTAKGDVFLFCSDGLRALSGQRIKEIMFSGITQGQSAEQIANQLLMAALASGRASDNVTLVIGVA